LKANWPRRARRISTYALLGFVTQQAVAMGASLLGVVHSYYEFVLGPYVAAWPAPPSRFDRVWVGCVGPSLFPMPDPGSGDNGDRGASSGLASVDRAQQPPYLVADARGFTAVWRAPRGSFLGRPLGEQWALVGPIDPRVLDGYARLDAVLGGVPQPPTADELLEVLGEHHTPTDPRSPSGSDRRGSLRKSVAAFEHAFGPIRVGFPQDCWPSDRSEPGRDAIGSQPPILMRTSASWGWPLASIRASGSYEWNGSFGPHEATSRLLDPEDESFDWDKCLAWRDELCALLSAAPEARADGVPLWTLVDHDWIALPRGFASAELSTFVPGVPWRPLGMGAILNTAFFAFGIWCIRTHLIGTAIAAVQRLRARRADRCKSCGYPRRGLARGAACPECGRA